MIKTVYFDDGTYVGEVNEQDIPHGKGTITYADGNVVDGTMEDDYWVEITRVSFPDGRVFNGLSDDYEGIGNGTMTYPNGIVFTGEVGNLCEGTPSEGKMVFPDGLIFEGRFDCDGTPEDGTILYTDGTKYVGALSILEWNGTGTFFDKNGDEYFCAFWDNIRQSNENFEVILKRGERRILGKFKNGEFVLEHLIYTGEKNHLDLPHGKGKLIRENGDVYEGDFVNGSFHGKGKYIWNSAARDPLFAQMYNDLREYEGDYVNGERHGYGKMKLHDTWTYEGEFKNDTFYGYGKLNFGKGTKKPFEVLETEGIFEGNLYHKASAPYKCTYISGTRFEGIAGIGANGTLYYPDGSKFEGEWDSRDDWNSGTLTLKDGTSFSSDKWNVFEDERAHLKYDHICDDVEIGSSDYVTMTQGGRTIEGRIRDRVFTSNDKSITYTILYLFEATQQSDTNDEDTSPRDIYDGGINRRGEYHGMGTMRYASGEKYSGAWAHGDWHGQGLYITPDGVTYSGFFSSTRESSNVTRIAEGEAPQHGTMRNGAFFKDEK